MNEGSLKRIVMLIDDDSIDNFINERVIKSAGFAYLTYVHTTVPSALEFLKNLMIIGEVQLLPEYILLDINLPIIDGFHFLESFDRLPESFRSIKLIVLTASLNPDDEVKCRAHKQVVEYLHKPLTVETLTNLK